MINNSVLKKYSEFITLGIGKEVHQPDTFLRDIHNDYIKNNKKNIGEALYITWYLTDVCNLNCFFCSAKALCGKKSVKYKNTMKIAEKIASSSCLYVSILGGEPTLCEDLLNIVKLFNAKHIFTEIVSNGFGIDDKFVSELLRLNSDLIRIKLSLDSCVEFINDSMRGMGSFANVMKALDVLKNTKIDVRLQMVVTNANKHQIYDMYKLAESKNCNSFGFSAVMPIGRGVKVSMIKIDQEILDQLIKIRREEKNTKLQQYNLGTDNYRYMKQLFGTVDNLGLDGENLSILKCNACRYRLCVSKDGDVFPCDMTRFDEFKLGNILKTDLKKMMKSKKAKSFNKITKKTKVKCKDCKYKWCNSGCFGICYEQSKYTGKIQPMCEI